MTPLPEVIAAARRLGLYGNTAKRLVRAVRRSTPQRDPHWNRRLFSLVFAVAGDRIEGVARI